MPDGLFVLGRYVLIAQIGRGGGGSVWRAYDPELKREVAVKLLHATGLETNGRNRLLREAQAAASLSHPNVVTVFDVGEHESPQFGSGVFMVMELLDGATLSAHIERSEPLSWREKIRLYFSAGEGLAAAHAVGLVHRDFKPANVIVSSAGIVKVVDFGLARAYEPDAHPPASLDDGRQGRVHPSLLNVRLTAENVVMGTPLYMSPESLQGEDSGVLGDQYSFCAALYEALAGEPPVRANDVAELRRMKKLRPRSPQRGEVPAWVWSAICRGLEPEPRNRWPTLQDLLDVLEEAMRPRRPSWGVVVSILLGGVLGVGLWAALASARDTIEPPRCAPLEAQARDLRLEHTEAVAAMSPASARLVERMDAWDAELNSACEPLSADATERLEERALALDCLAADLATIQTVHEILDQGEQVNGRRLDMVVADLPSPERCSNPRRRSGPQGEREIDSMGVLLELGEYERARALAQELRTSTNAVLRARAEFTLARVELDARRFERAEKHALEAIELADTNGDDAAALQAHALLIATAQERYQYDKAELASELSFARLRAMPAGSPGLDRLEAQVLLRTGNLFEETGRHERALESLNAARRIVSRRYGDDHPDMVEVHKGLSAVAQKTGRREAGARHLEESARLSMVFYGPNHGTTAALYNNAARFHASNGDFGQAVELMGISLRAKESLFGRRSPTTLTSRAQLAGFQLKQGSWVKGRETWTPELWKELVADDAVTPLLRAVEAKLRLYADDCIGARSLYDRGIAGDRSKAREPEDELVRAESMMCSGELERAALEMSMMVRHAPQLLPEDLEAAVANLVEVSLMAGDIELARVLLSDWRRNFASFPMDRALRRRLTSMEVEVNAVLTPTNSHGRRPGWGMSFPSPGAVVTDPPERCRLARLAREPLKGCD